MQQLNWNKGRGQSSPVLLGGYKLAKKEEKTEEKEEFKIMAKGAITVISPVHKIKEYEQNGYKIVVFEV